MPGLRSAPAVENGDMRATRTSIVLLLLCVAAGGGAPSALAGGGPRPPHALLAAAIANLRGADAIRIALTGADSDGASAARLDYAGGDVEVSLREAGERLSLRVVDGAYYVRANAAYWRRETKSSTAAERLADRWVKAPASKDLRSAAVQLSPRRLAHCIGVESGTVSDGGTAVVGGRRTTVVVSAGDRPGTAPGRYYLAASGPARLLRYVQTGPDRHGGKADPLCDRDYTTRHADVRFAYRATRITAPPGAIDLGDTTDAGTV
jgi:hypothetical protein